MADIDVVRKRRSSVMYWVLAAVVLAILAWWLMGRSPSPHSGVPRSMVEPVAPSMGALG